MLKQSTNLSVSVVSSWKLETWTRFGFSWLVFANKYSVLCPIKAEQQSSGFVIAFPSLLYWLTQWKYSSCSSSRDYRYEYYIQKYQVLDPIYWSCHAISHTTFYMYEYSSPLEFRVPVLYCTVYRLASTLKTVISIMPSLLENRFNIYNASNHLPVEPHVWSTTCTLLYWRKLLSAPVGDIQRTGY